MLTYEKQQQLREVCKLAVSKKRIKPLMGEVMNACKDLVPTHRFSLWIDGPYPYTIATMVGHGLEQPIIIDSSTGIAGACMRLNEDLYTDDAYNNKHFNCNSDHGIGYVTRSVSCHVVSSRDNVPVAVLQAINRINDVGEEIYIPCEERTIKVIPFSEEDRFLLSEVASFLGIAIENAQLLSSQESFTRNLCLLLADVVDKRDGVTGAHTRSVIDISVAIASELTLSKKEIKIIEMEAALHDIGKVGIPDNVLNFPGKLSPADWNMMMGHALEGRKLLSGFQWPPHLVRVPYESTAHHERLNGKGYPDGLSGKREEVAEGGIPLSVRIIAVADVFDALTQLRPYKNTMNPQDAIGICKTSVPHEFDADVVGALSGLLERYKFNMLLIRDLAKNIRAGLYSDLFN